MSDDELKKIIEEISRHQHLDEEDIEKLRANYNSPPVSPYVFRSYVEDGVPYSGPVWGIGNVVHVPDALFCVRSVNKEAIDEEEVHWLQKALIDGGVLLGLSTIVLDKRGDYWWTEDTWRNPKGKKFDTVILGKNAKTGKYFTGKEGHRIGRELARKKSLPFKYLAKAGEAISVVLIIKDMRTNGLTTSNVSDTVFGALSFVPGVGWVVTGISMVYTVADCYVEHKTGKTIKEHTEDYLFTKYVEFQNAFRAFLNSMIPFPMFSR